MEDKIQIRRAIDLDRNEIEELILNYLHIDKSCKCRFDWGDYGVSIEIDQSLEKFIPPKEIQLTPKPSVTVSYGVGITDNVSWVDESEITSTNFFTCKDCKQLPGICGHYSLEHNAEAKKCPGFVLKK